MVIHLIAGLIKKISYNIIARFKKMISSYVFKTLTALQHIKMSQYFPKPYDHLVEILMLNLIFQIMQQKQILTIFHMLTFQVLH